MDKVLKVLQQILPENQINEAKDALEELLAQSREELEEEFNEKLEEAYSALAGEIKESEATAEQGYQEAYSIIQDLRSRLELQRQEFENTLEENYEEAYQLLLSERGKNNNVEVDLYKEFDDKLGDMKEYMVDKLDQFLHTKGQEIYAQARRDVLSDPTMAEHRVVLDKIVEHVSGYLSDEDHVMATSSKLDEAQRAIEELKGQVRILEAKNIRVSTENNRLVEQVRHNSRVLNENTTNERKERVSKAGNVQGRGQVVDSVITENRSHATNATVDSIGNEALYDLNVLAGTRKSS